MIGRFGCALPHDHRGFASEPWIAVKMPGGPRCDLGLIEFLFLIEMVIAFRLLDRRPCPVGFFLGRSHERWAVPDGNVSGGRNLGLAVSEDSTNCAEVPGEC